MRKILVVGCGGHAKVVIDILEKHGTYKVFGLLDHNKPKGYSHFGYEVLGDNNILGRLTGEVDGIIIGIGDNFTRAKVAAQISEVAPDLEFISAIHPGAELARGVEIGAGSVVMAGAVINPDTKIGKHSIINTGARVDHDCRIGDFACVLPGATLGGNVQVGEFSAICLGASVIHNIIIGDHCVVGAGAVVVENIHEYSQAYGVPARVAKIRKAGDPYL